MAAGERVLTPTSPQSNMLASSIMSSGAKGAASPTKASSKGGSDKENGAFDMRSMQQAMSSSITAAGAKAPSSPTKSPTKLSGDKAKSMLAKSTATPAAEPTMSQLLAQAQNGGLKGTGAAVARRQIDTSSSAGDYMSWRKGQGFKPWEKQLLQSPEVKRKSDVAQLFFFDYYFDLISYVGARKSRCSLFKQDVISRNLTGPALASEWSSYCGRERVLLRKRRTKLLVDQFHIICQVGQGGYGEVYLARRKDTGEVAALKKMKKKTLAKMDEIRHVLTERDILTATRTPWLVKLLYAFQDPEHVYLAMEYVPGGDFRTLLNNSGVLKEEHARFYIAEMFCSVDALHKLGYIHRDLKPENFLIDSTGHIKLTDFGLAAGALNPGKIQNLKHRLDEVKQDQELIFRSTIEMKSIYKSLRNADARYADSVVGSPDYMAPETLRGQPYTFSVDYWSLGAILFEFLAGFPPFSGASPEETWNNLRNWTRYLRRPHYDREEDKIFNLSDNGWAAITALLADKKSRVSRMDDLKSLPFFAGVPWDTLRDKPAPFIPALDSEVDAGYFDNFEDPADMAKYAEVREKARNVDAVQEKDEPFGRGVFVGFTFKPKKRTDGDILGITNSTVSEDTSMLDDGEMIMMF
ncbi:uncharacterized protein L969DRAFT_88911 [Mixia osmundae IAM 14324]|nr:uncharacterized protein L969DRAFT_88911 [Mixia osmundae IAM 14324]KEI38472.1 hypothetical protein L969DRAFT_88911 [Mixia osmundae IAM 14324]